MRMRFFGIYILFILFVVVAPNNGTACDNDLCCHVQEMSRKCSSKGNPMNDITYTDIDTLKREVASLKDLLTWYKARNGKFYKVFKEWQNYTRAMERCVEEGAQLVTDGIRNTETRSELESLIKASGESTWIGLDDLKEEGKWCWIDHVIANMEQINWSRHQPDDNKGDEDCAHYWKTAGWYVNDAPCHHKLYFLCEKE